ncbi:hypothetical protein SDC9_64554 [bioreactor metagenome]|uniref:Uncharacterized protein n=1 Tax=bioreactor metagenome TaxID=1076179 RepID=A0A644XQV0_9ZZZZ
MRGFHGGFAAECIERKAHIQRSRALAFDLTEAVELLRQRAVGHNLDHLLRRVAVRGLRFLQTVGHDNLGGKRCNHLRQVVRQAGFAVALRHHIVGVVVGAGEPRKQRIFAHAHRPEGAERLFRAFTLAKVRNVENRGFYAALERVVRQRAAEFLPFRAGFGGDEQQVRLFRRRFPALDARGQFLVRAVHADVGNRAFFQERYRNTDAGGVEFEILVEHAVGNGRFAEGCAGCVRLQHGVLRRSGIPAQKYTLLGRFKRKRERFLRFERNTGNNLPVAQPVSVLRFFLRQFKCQFARLRRCGGFRFLRERGGRKRHQRQTKQKRNPLFRSFRNRTSLQVQHSIILVRILIYYASRKPFTGGEPFFVCAAPF